MRVLILWADTRSANLGVRVLAEGTAALVRRALGDGVRIDFQNFEVGDSDVAFNKKGLLNDLVRPNGSMKKKIRQYDLIVDTGAGDSFTDIYGVKRQLLMFYVHILAKWFRVPYILSPQTIGPFGSHLSRLLGKISLSNAAAVISRDSVSWQAAKEAGRTPSCDSTDVVFMLPRPEPSVRRDIVLNVSGLLWSENRHVSSSKYQEWIHMFLAEAERRGRRVTLLAHVIGNHTSDDDEPAVAQIAELMGDKVECIVPATLDQAREVVASANLVVGSRMHACLNAISIGTPSIPWAYSRKFFPLMNDLGWKHVVDLRSTDDPVSETFGILDSTSKESLQDELNGALIQTEDRLAQAVGEIQKAVSSDPRLQRAAV